MIQNTNPRHEAYCAFMRRHRETVWRVCWHFARHGRGDRSDRMARAEDMAQEVWIVLWLKFDQINPEYTEKQQRHHTAGKSSQSFHNYCNWLVCNRFLLNRKSCLLCKYNYFI